MYDYTNRMFTKSSDRGPAMLGLAKAFAQATNDRMVHGLWKDDLAIGLIWVSGKNPSLGSEEEIHGLTIPSWSWLGLSGRIYWPAASAKEARECVSIRDSSLDEATMAITLQGLMFRFRDRASFEVEIEESTDPNIPWDVASVDKDWVSLRNIWVLVMVNPSASQRGFGLLLVKMESSGWYKRVGCMKLLSYYEDKEYEMLARDLSYQTITLH